MYSQFIILNIFCSCGDNLEFEEAWEVPEVADKEILHPLKESLGVDKEKADVEHAVQYFQQHANDFPGEFFLQSPFIYAVSGEIELFW